MIVTKRYISIISDIWFVKNDKRMIAINKLRHQEKKSGENSFSGFMFMEKYDQQMSKWIANILSQVLNFTYISHFNLDFTLFIFYKNQILKLEMGDEQENMECLGEYIQWLD